MTLIGLRENLMSNTVNILNGLELLYPDNPVISQLKRTLHSYPESEIGLADAYSIGQIKSKMWLIEHLPDNLGLVFICAGWYGTLASFMFDKVRHKFDKIRSFDIDPSCYKVADTINKPWVIDGWQFKASTLDIKIMQYPTEHTAYRSNGTSQTLIEDPNTIINTSCEHIDNFDAWYSNIPEGKIVVLQTNNFFEVNEHINCSESLEEFSNQTPMHTVFYSGELTLEKYTRYMRIGIK
jgi:hypothetical protein